VCNYIARDSTDSKIEIDLRSITEPPFLHRPDDDRGHGLNDTYLSAGADVDEGQEPFERMRYGMAHCSMIIYGQ
jgi:hypothetical protein